MKRLLVLSLLALPLGASPTFRLFDCGGSLQDSCLSLFPGTRTPYNVAYTIDANFDVIFQGYNLGRFGAGGGETGAAPVYYLHPYVLGVTADQEGDGQLIRWTLGSDPAPVPEGLDIYGELHYPVDMNSQGQFVGGSGRTLGSSYASGAFYGDLASGYACGLDWQFTFDLIEDSQRLQYIYFSPEYSVMLRINEHGQALGYTSVNVGVTFDPDGEPNYERAHSEIRLFMLSPIGARSPAPEPSTALLLGAGLACGAMARRRRAARRILNN